MPGRPGREGSLYPRFVIDISVVRQPGGAFEVCLRGDGYDTIHSVTVPPELVSSVGCEGATDEELVRASFLFLLEREAPTSILGRFSLDQITTYFPEFPAEVGQFLS